MIRLSTQAIPGESTSTNSRIPLNKRCSAYRSRGCSRCIILSLHGILCASTSRPYHYLWKRERQIFMSRTIYLDLAQLTYININTDINTYSHIHIDTHVHVLSYNQDARQDFYGYLALSHPVLSLSILCLSIPPCSAMLLPT